MLQAVRAAKREKIRNKTREKDRARRGVWNTRTLKRMRQGPPAHIMVKLSAKNALRDKIIRSPSEVGYVAKMKRSMGMKLKHAPRWDPEAGSPELRNELDQIEKDLSRLNSDKRT
jgi:hypothetical protein